MNPSKKQVRTLEIGKTLHIRLVKQKYVELLNFIMEKHGLDMSKATFKIFEGYIVLQKENTTLKNDNQFLQEAMNLSTSDKNAINKALYPECEDAYPIEGEPSKRECGRKDKDRFVSLPKINGKFTVDNPKKCERCQEIERRIIQLQIERRGKVTRKDVLISEAKKSLYQHAEKTAKDKDTTHREEIKRFHEQKKREVHNLQNRVNQTLVEQRTMRNGGNGKTWFRNEFGQKISYETGQPIS